MKPYLRTLLFLVLLSAFSVAAYYSFARWFSGLGGSVMGLEPGTPVDTLNGVIVYYNGAVSHVDGRNVSSDGYNLGLKWQCVEFVKRYYYEYHQHKMPDSYGHAVDFFDPALDHGAYNKRRGLFQYQLPGTEKPEEGDLIVFDKTYGNAYGHVAIISRVDSGEVEIVQQNPGPLGSSRDVYRLDHQNGKWILRSSTVLGFLRKKSR